MSLEDSLKRSDERNIRSHEDTAEGPMSEDTKKGVGVVIRGGIGVLLKGYLRGRAGIPDAEITDLGANHYGIKSVRFSRKQIRGTLKEIGLPKAFTLVE